MSYKSVFGLGIFRYNEGIIKKLILHILVLFTLTFMYLIVGYDSSHWNGIDEEQDKNFPEKFFNRFYFSTITFSTAGYGDISPRSTRVRIVTIIFALIMLIEYYLLYKLK